MGTVSPSQMPGLPAPGVIATFDGVEIVVDENPVFGPGVFIASDRCVRLNAASKVTEFDCSQVSWSDGDGGNKASFDYRAIIMHSISTDPLNYPRPCIYCQIDTDFCTSVSLGGVEPPTVEEVRFVPADDASLAMIFDAMSKGAALNPDPVEEGEGDWIMNDADIDAGSREEMMLQQFDDMLVSNIPTNDNGQFDDVEGSSDDDNVM